MGRFSSKIGSMRQKKAKTCRTGQTSAMTTPEVEEGGDKIIRKFTINTQIFPRQKETFLGQCAMFP